MNRRKLLWTASFTALYASACYSLNETKELSMTNARVVLTTVGQKDAADKLAMQLVERRLAACVNIIGPIRSVYRWKHKVQNETEYLLLIKTTAQHAGELQSAFKQLHPYEVPECVQLSIADGSEEYLNWLAAEVSSGES